MMRLIFVLICALTSTAVADVNWRVIARGGPSFTEDAGFDLLAAEPVLDVGELLFERRVTDLLWASVGVASASKAGTAFETIDANWDQFSIKAAAVAQWALRRHLDWFARLGPTLNRTELKLHLKSERKSRSSISWDLGLQAGAGLNWAPIYRETAAGETTVAFGFILEANYQRIFPTDIEIGDAQLGSLDPSGPGLTIGVNLQW